MQSRTETARRHHQLAEGRGLTGQAPPVLPDCATWPGASRPPPCRVFAVTGARTLTPSPHRTSRSSPPFRPARGDRARRRRRRRPAAPRASPRRDPLLHAEEQPATCAPWAARSLPSGAGASLPRPLAPAARRAPSAAVSAPFPPGPSHTARRCHPLGRRPGLSPRARCCPLAEAWEDAGEPLS